MRDDSHASQGYTLGSVQDRLLGVADSDTGAKADALSVQFSALRENTEAVRSSSSNDSEALFRRPSASDRDLAGVLHEVSNALTVVLGWIDRARGDLDGLPSPEPALGALAVAASRARHARGIVRRAIGADVPDDGPTTVAAIIAEAATGCEPEAKCAGVSLSTSIDPSVEGAYLMGGSIILQILTNLLFNAVAVSSPGGAVSLDATIEHGDDIVFGVNDEGPGVPVERRANLLESGVTTRAGGAGIGLRYAAALARESGGVLSLARSDRGARFELRWPRRASMAPAAPRSGRKPVAVLAGKRILIVEDDPAVCDLLEGALEARGAVVVCARALDELSSALSSGTFDAALCDLSPLGADASASLAAIRERSPSVRLVLVSGSTLDVFGLGGGGLVQVRKPFEIAEIIAALTT